MRAVNYYNFSKNNREGYLKINLLILAFGLLSDWAKPNEGVAAPAMMT